MADTINVGIIGCGNIMAQYVKGIRMFDVLNLIACADLDVERAKARAAEFGIPQADSVESLLGDPNVQLVINLTVPQAHAEVSLAILAAGKHVYSEKPLALLREEGQKILAAAREKKLLVGCAPDTFLGGGLQTARKLIDDGQIGRPVAATAFMMSHGPESWHPNPFFYYQPGGGPMFDMGPYYLTALIHLLGPVKRVSGSTQVSFTERTATSKHHPNVKIPVEVHTHVTGLMDFEKGAVGTIITSFDVWGHHMPPIEIYGSDGSLSVPDPNMFGGKVLLHRYDTNNWQEIPLTHDSQMVRGIGPADMAMALCFGRPHRATGELAYHVLDIMHAFHDSSETGNHINLNSTCAQPAPLPAGMKMGELDRA